MQDRVLSTILDELTFLQEENALQFLPMSKTLEIEISKGLASNLDIKDWVLSLYLYDVSGCEEAFRRCHQGQHWWRSRHGSTAHHIPASGPFHRLLPTPPGLPRLPRGRQSQGPGHLVRMQKWQRRFIFRLSRNWGKLNKGDYDWNLTIFEFF